MQDVDSSVKSILGLLQYSSSGFFLLVAYTIKDLSKSSSCCLIKFGLSSFLGLFYILRSSSYLGSFKFLMSTSFLGIFSFLNLSSTIVFFFIVQGGPLDPRI